jgi:hypothetical protein
LPDRRRRAGVAFGAVVVSIIAKSRELLEPVHHGAIAGNTGETIEPREQRIAGDVAQVLEPPRPDSSKAITSSHRVGTAIVVAELVLTQAPTDAMVKPDQVKVTAQQLQPAVRSKLFATKFDRKIPP